MHFLDLARFFMGPVNAVFARRAESQTSAATTAGTWAVSLRFASGAVGNLLLSSLASWDYVNEHVDLVGSNHNALSVESGRVVRVFRHDDARRVQHCENTLSGHWWSGNEEQGFTGQFRVFAQAILAGSRMPHEPEDVGPLAAGPEDGLRALELLEAVRESAVKGQSISLPVGGAEAAVGSPLAGGRQRKVSS
jgi:predicted dehydrogenase